MSTQRRWYTSALLVPRIALRTLAMLRLQGLGRFTPLLLVLLVGSVLLWIINGIAPLAPFIYSLF
jgi:hypothetical protein